MAVGTVKFFKVDKGYGFLESDAGGDVFMHIRDLNKSNVHEPKQGERYEFEKVAEGTKVKAINFKRVA